MKNSPEIPPWVAVVVIVLVLVVAGAMIWRGTGKKTMSVSEQAKMEEIMKQRGFTLKGQQPPPMSTQPGMSSQAATPQQAPR